MLFFLFIKDSKKKYPRFNKKIKQHNSFNADNESEWFLKDHVTLKTNGWWEFSAASQKYIVLKYIKTGNQY